MKLQKIVIRILFVFVILTSVCALSTSVQGFSITFDMRGSEGSVVDGLASRSVTKDGLTSTLAANSGFLNKTGSGFGINAKGVGDDTDAIDNGVIDEFVTIEFDKLVKFDQLVLSSFTSKEESILTIAGGFPITLVGTGPSTDIYNFSTDNIIPIGQSVMLSYSSGNGFSFDEFTVTLDESTAVPEPATIILFGIGLAGLGGCFLRERFKLQAKQ